MEMDETMSRYTKVCVTGGAGFVGSSLVEKLLRRGDCIVHATLRSLGDASKVGLLRSLEGAETRLKLFEADIYNPSQFEEAINGCRFVFHVATPFLHTQGSQYESTTDAAVAGARSIATSCARSGTVRRLIYTATVVSASPLKDDASGGYMDTMDESCWSPMDFSVPSCFELEKDYLSSKTQTERELLRFGEAQKEGGGALEVVTLACGLMGGGTVLPHLPLSVANLIAQLTQDERNCWQLTNFLEGLLGRIPIIHIDDVCDAHMFCMDQSSINGRFLCASHYVSSAEIAEYYKRNYPELHVNPKYLEGPKRDIRWGSTKLIERGFEYKHDMRSILDVSLRCAKGFGVL